MRILITGICGFVGSTLAEAWLEAESGLVVYGLDNFVRPGSEGNRVRLQALGIRLFHGDIWVASDVEALPAVDWVIDAAASPSLLAGVDDLSGWCADRYGPHPVAGNPETRRFDVPWLIMDVGRAGEVWGWSPQTPLASILEEMALHAERHPHWLELSGLS